MNPLLDPQYVAMISVKYATFVKFVEYATEYLKGMPLMKSIGKKQKVWAYPLVAFVLTAVLVWVPGLMFGVAVSAGVVLEQSIATVIVWAVTQGMVKRKNDLAVRSSGSSK